VTKSPPVEGGGTDVLEGTIKRIVFTGAEDSWSVVRLTTGSHEATVTAVGHLPGVQPGESVRLVGQWQEDRRWGRQFKVETFMSVTPNTALGIEKYLGSGLLSGIGPVMAKRLVARFALETLDVIDQEPERLSEVQGMGPVRIQRIREAWEDARHTREVMVFLQSHGISAAYAARIAKRYGRRAIARVRENPYRLAADIHGIGFLTADAIARRLGIAADAPQRADAGVLFALDRGTLEGHVFLPARMLLEEASRLLELPEAQVEAALARLADNGGVMVDRGAAAGDDAVYPPGLHGAETRLAARLLQLLREPSRMPPLDVERALTWVQQQQGPALAAEQHLAVERGLTSKVLVVTGGPGTGKTTLVNAIIRILERKEQRILLAAPTGRAARRLSESSGREASTLHRLLEFQPQDGSFLRDEDHPLEADLVIVDEVSMVDLPMADRLVQALPLTARLILVGDVDQLPSVGPGAILGDLIHSRAVDVVRLTEIFRQARESRIVVNAHRVNQGELPAMEGDDADSDFFFIARDDPEEAVAAVRTLVGERIPRRFKLDPVEDIQVLCPMHRGLLGTSHLNEVLRELLNPTGPELKRGERIFRQGDKVMQIRNDYDREVANGDLGRIVSIDREEGGLEVAFEGRQVAYRPADLDELVPAYACSIHKSQGSEYPGVVLLLHHQHHVMLQRNLLYTAITRARRLVVMVGSRRALARAVHNDQVQERHSRLAARLQAVAGQV
jgi:exodeoxyribonuclease V alpha subunit